MASSLSTVLYRREQGREQEREKREGKREGVGGLVLGRLESVATGKNIIDEPGNAAPDATLLTLLYTHPQVNQDVRPVRNKPVVGRHVFWTVDEVGGTVTGCRRDGGRKSEGQCPGAGDTLDKNWRDDGGE